MQFITDQEAFMGINILFSFTTSIIGAIVISIILIRHKQTSAWFLAFFLFTLAISNFFFFLFESRLLLYVPFFFRWGPLINYLTAPAMYFYILFALCEKRQLKWLDALHLLPAVIFFIDYLPLYASSNLYKRQIIESLYASKESVILLKEGWLISAGTHYILRHIIALFYVIYLAYWFIRPESLKLRKHLRNKELLSWVAVIIVLMFLFSVSGIITGYFAHSYFAWISTIWQPFIIFSILCLILLSKPNILYGANIVKSIEPEEEKPKQLIIGDDVSMRVQASLSDYLKHQHFLRKNIKIGDVADELGVPPYILSAYINQMYHMRFNDLINSLRVEYVADGMVNGEWHVLTLEAIAKKAGFSNRTTFLSAFKKFKGMTPTAYLQLQKNGNLSEKKPEDN